MNKYFDWNFQGTNIILPPPKTGNRYRIFACAMGCNEHTDSAVVHEGIEKPQNGSEKVIDFVSASRPSNPHLPAPYLTEPGNGIYLTVESKAIPKGKGLLIYTEEGLL